MSGGMRLRGAGGKQEVALGFVLIFELFTQLPLSLFCKLLSIFLKKLKISKNESCSTFHVLQLWFKKLFQILPHFEFHIWGTFKDLNHSKITPNFVCKLEKL